MGHNLNEPDTGMTQAKPIQIPGLTRPLVLIDNPDISIRTDPSELSVGIDRKGVVPEVDVSRFDVLVTVAQEAPAPWVVCDAGRLDGSLQRISDTIGKAPVATTILTEVLRLAEGLSFEGAISLESLAYSTLLSGQEFATWLKQRPLSNLEATTEPAEPVLYIREDDTVTLLLSSPDTRNAMTARMRDSFHEALTNVLEDPSDPRLVLRGDGKCFSVGGFLPEFGTASDVALAHLVRTHRSCAILLNRLRGRAEVFMQGACIGSGLEITAAAGRRYGYRNSFFQLPELGMGLIPGAGGTVTVPRAIGRHRALWMMLTGTRLSARQALDWGLIHGIVE